MEQNEEIEVSMIPTTPMELLAKAEIDVQISTAKAFPRSIKKSLDRALSLATISEEVAQSCTYALPRGGKHLEGPSIRLAEIVASTYGNIRYAGRVVGNDGKWITSQGVCHDLESNTCSTVEVKRRITDRNGRTFNEDMQTVAGNAATAIAIRNAIFKVIPYSVVASIHDQVKEVAKGSAETLPARRQKAVDYFKGLGVKEAAICEILDVQKIEDIDLEKLSILRGMVSLIKNGESTVEDLFAPKSDGENVADRWKI